MIRTQTTPNSIVHPNTNHTTEKVCRKSSGGCIAPDAQRNVKSGLYKTKDGEEIVCPHGNDKFKLEDTS